jgi:hypothetical protein
MPARARASGANGGCQLLIPFEPPVEDRTHNSARLVDFRIRKAIVHSATVPALVNNPGPDELCRVFREVCLGSPQCREQGAGPHFIFAQMLDDLQPERMGYRFADLALHFEYLSQHLLVLCHRKFLNITVSIFRNHYIRAWNDVNTIFDALPDFRRVFLEDRPI